MALQPNSPKPLTPFKNQTLKTHTTRMIPFSKLEKIIWVNPKPE